MIKRFIIATLLVAIVCGGLVGFNLFRDQAIADFFANRPEQEVVITASEAAAGAWRPGIEAVGTAKASSGVEVPVEAAGVVREILFQANSRVSKGQVLVRLSDEVDRAELAALRSRLQTSEAQLMRVRELQERGVSTQAAYDEALTQVDTARSSLARLEAVIGQKSIEAPFDGVIGIPRLDIGSYVQPGALVATLQDLDVMRVDFTVPEQLAGSLRIGQTASFGSGTGKMDYRGHIIGIEPRVDPQTRLVAVRAELDNREGTLLPGQFVHVRVDLPEEPNVVTLPQTAVVPSLYGDYVYIVEESGEGEAKRLRARQAFVKPGRRNGDQIEIVSGLQPGQMVVTSGQNKLSNNVPVKIDNRIDPARLASIQ
ncbi:efflux RND transporter periplasmic adaptor subunit [Telmatospirillum sp. J64-1]|uniref:efflux RND transporter periplasmic adaptor subunit n=1 Tax=Telmatospirillum sp. J64-1 TaxID=2502183 RepID=UPI00115D73D4|nr:efflux RND transporter periplasmic adaptor subunit [Telmatospirillum sp. J64-1]